jgi:hypothetical protein
LEKKFITSYDTAFSAKKQGVLPKNSAQKIPPGELPPPTGKFQVNLLF